MGGTKAGGCVSWAVAGEKLLRKTATTKNHVKPLGGSPGHLNDAIAFPHGIV